MNLARLFALSLAALLLAAPVAAHEGHAGARVTLLKLKPALKALLPEGASLSKRKQRLDGELVTYYLARDGKRGPVLAAALVETGDYRHGKIRVAVGLDADHRLTGAALLMANEKYVPDFRESTGVGVLEDWRGRPLQTLIQAADQAPEGPRRTVLQAMKRGAQKLAKLLETAGGRR